MNASEAKNPAKPGWIRKILGLAGAFQARPRLLVAAMGNVVLVLLLNDMALWRGFENEIWRSFRLGIAAGFSLVCALTVAARGTRSERLAGALLATFPLICLLTALAAG